MIDTAIEEKDKEKNDGSDCYPDKLPAGLAVKIKKTLGKFSLANSIKITPAKEN